MLESTAHDTPTPPPVETPETLIDPDEALLARLEAEAAAEEGNGTETSGEGEGASPDPAADGGGAAAAPATATEPEKGSQPAPEGAAAPAGQQTNVRVPGMVPVAVAQQERRVRQEAEREAAYWRGVAEARAAAASNVGGGQPQKPQPTIDEQIATHRQALAAAAAKVDQGDMSMAEFVKAQQEADEAIARLRLDQLRAQQAAHQTPMAPATPAAPSLADEMVLEQQVQALQVKHPWTRADSPLTDEQYQFLRATAENELRMEGQVVPTGPRGTMILRDRVAALTDLYGPRWHPTWTPPAATPQPPAATPGAPAVPLRQQQALEKLGVAAAMPPNTTQMGHIPPAGESIEAQISAMSQAELEAYLDANPTVEKQLGLT